jgi:hypothetical protein
VSRSGCCLQCGWGHSPPLYLSHVPAADCAAGGMVLLSSECAQLLSSDLPRLLPEGVLPCWMGDWRLKDLEGTQVHGRPAAPHCCRRCMLHGSCAACLLLAAVPDSCCHPRTLATTALLHAHPCWHLLLNWKSRCASWGCDRGECKGPPSSRPWQPWRRATLQHR